MADEKKRQCEASEQESEAKRQRPETVEDVVFPTKIDDINVDCLEHVFNHMSLMDLINVADANKYLGQAATLAFARRSKGKTVDIRFNNFLSHCGIMQLIEITDNAIIINKPKPAFQILRLFGAFISNIKIFGDSSKEIINELFTYVNENCSESLKTISIKQGPKYFLEKPKKPFKNVEEISITDGSLCFELSVFNDIFPQMRRLKLIDPSRSYKRFATKFHQLEDLHIACFNGLTTHITKDIIRLNPQIKSLVVWGKVELGFWDYVSKKLKQLRVLGLKYVHGKSSQYNKDPIRFECVEVLKLEVLNKFINGKSSNLGKVFAFKQLKECTISVYDVDENLCNFIIENPTIEKLDILLLFHRSTLFADEANVLKIVEKLPKLTELSILTVLTLSVNGAIRILNASQTLRKLSLTVSKVNGLDGLYSADIPEWNATKKLRSITFERK